MLVYKFGGASIKNSDAIVKMAQIILRLQSTSIIVISAIDKTTNKLEHILDNYFAGKDNSVNIDNLIQFHQNIIRELNIENDFKFFDTFEKLKLKISTKPSLDYDYEYDQIVSFGELLSTQIISTYLLKLDNRIKYVDIRNVIRTDRHFRKASVLWEISSEIAKETFINDDSLYITQGFISSSTNNQTTTLGREGSDFSAAILANICDASKVVVWKDVPGIMNADPNRMTDVVKIDHLSYKEAIELTYYGAKVIHSKTIEPLKRKLIPLYVKSFIDTSLPGSLVDAYGPDFYRCPVYIYKDNQVLVSISPKNDNMLDSRVLLFVFDLMHELRISINLTQMSASSFTFCVDNTKNFYSDFIKKLNANFNVRYNERVELVTIRYYNEKSLELVKKDAKILIEQKTRKTAQIVKLI